MFGSMSGFSRICACVLVSMCLVAYASLGKAEETSDFSSLTWVEAFERLHERISREYAFTDWKGIDWETLGSICMERVDKAQASDDFDAYYLALREYTHAIPDGHMRVSNVSRIDEKYIGGGFGFAAAMLSDSRVIAGWVDEASPVWAAGLRAGDELLTWNGQSVQEALRAVSTVFASNSATDEDAMLKKVQYLVRAPIGTQVSLSFRHGEEQQPVLAELTAYHDDRASLKKGYPDAVISDKVREMFLGVETDEPAPENIVEQKVLEGNVGYVKIWGELDADLQGTGTCLSTLSLLRQAVSAIIDAGCPGLILDLRNNVGGVDEMAAAMLGSFYSEKSFYEYQNAYDPATGVRSIHAADVNTDSPVLWIEPAEVVYTGRVIALINQKCVSSGEGLAMGISNLASGETLGFYGTHGSFGLCGPEATLPGGLTVHWPSGQSLDEDRRIQLDSRAGEGGVAPTIRIPMTRENALRVARGEDVELEEALRLLAH